MVECVYFGVRVVCFRPCEFTNNTSREAIYVLARKVKRCDFDTDYGFHATANTAFQPVMIVAMRIKRIRTLDIDELELITII